MTVNSNFNLEDQKSCSKWRPHLVESALEWSWMITLPYSSLHPLVITSALDMTRYIITQKECSSAELDLFPALKDLRSECESKWPSQPFVKTFSTEGPFRVSLFSTTTSPTPSPRLSPSISCSGAAVWMKKQYMHQPQSHSQVCISIYNYVLSI